MDNSYPIGSTTAFRDLTKVPKMKNGPIVLNIAKPILPAHRTDDVRGDAARRCVTYSHTFNLINTSIPPTLHRLSIILHIAVSAVSAAVLRSRPRPLRLARRVSSRAIFVAFPLPTCRGVPTFVPHTFTPEIRKKPFSVRNLWTLPISIDIPRLWREESFISQEISLLQRSNMSIENHWSDRRTPAECYVSKQIMRH